MGRGTMIAWHKLGWRVTCGVAWRPIFRWYDLWIGVYIAPGEQRAFIFPIPCCGVEVRW
jgi:hypothetical protein